MNKKAQIARFRNLIIILVIIFAVAAIIWNIVTKILG